MNKEIKEIITINGEKVCRVTCPDERWYSQEIKNKKTGLPEYFFYPSVTWIKSYYYINQYLIKWIVGKGLDEAEAVKKEAGLKGDKIHQATEDIDKGIKIAINAKYLNKTTGEMEELTADEYEAIMSYRNFIDKEKPELLANEMTVFSPENSQEKYAGTLDRIFAMGKTKKGIRQIVIFDIKTSQSIWKDMIIQVSAYGHSDIDYKRLDITNEEWSNRKLFIGQFGYKKNKNKYKITEMPDRYDLFKIAYNIWNEENKNVNPLQRDFPLSLQSQFRINQLKKNKNMKKELKELTPYQDTKTGL